MGQIFLGSVWGTELEGSSQRSVKLPSVARWPKSRGD